MAHTLPEMEGWPTHQETTRAETVATFFQLLKDGGGLFVIEMGVGGMELYGMHMNVARPHRPGTAPRVPPL